MHDERQYVRHPTDIAVEVREINESEMNLEHLKNVSFGGVAFESDRCWKRGSIIAIQVLVEPAIEIKGKVAWCKEYDKHFEVGVQLIDTTNGSSRDNLVDEVCQVERYKQMLADIIENLYNYSSWSNVL
ncbi:MAG: PilZ domain-containing protein [Candidatus Parabeggiatoa sp.]|nr:PilZ domain-containing protein [Candidatus Parabeggiatoa sp.]